MNFSAQHMLVENHSEKSYIDLAKARMVELADTLASGASGRKAVQVQILFRAQEGSPPRAPARLKVH
jgi:hypothetical protein